MLNLLSHSVNFDSWVLRINFSKDEFRTFRTFLSFKWAVNFWGFFYKSFLLRSWYLKPLKLSWLLVNGFHQFYKTGFPLSWFLILSLHNLKIWNNFLLFMFEVLFKTSLKSFSWWNVSSKEFYLRFQGINFICFSKKILDERIRREFVHAWDSLLNGWWFDRSLTKIKCHGKIVEGFWCLDCALRTHRLEFVWRRLKLAFNLFFFDLVLKTLQHCISKTYFHLWVWLLSKRIRLAFLHFS